MRLLVSLISISLSVASLTFGESRTKRYLYLGMPDGAQQEGRSAPGILICDIDDSLRGPAQIPYHTIIGPGLKPEFSTCFRGCLQISTRSAQADLHPPDAGFVSARHRHRRRLAGRRIWWKHGSGLVETICASGRGRGLA